MIREQFSRDLLNPYLIWGLGIVAILPVPLILAISAGVPLYQMLTLVGSALLIEYGAGAVGVALGISPLVIILTLASVCTGLLLLLFGIFIFLGEKSEHVANFLKNTGNLMERHPYIWKWGILSLVPGEIILGIYFMVPAAWILHWDIRKSAVLIFAGNLAGGIVTIYSAMGLLQILFP